jgi:hypothetical protein
VSGASQLQSLYHCFLTVMVNVSPYCKTLSMAAAVKLVSLFELFTAPSFLYKEEGNYVYVALLLEVLTVSVSLIFCCIFALVDLTSLCISKVLQATCTCVSAM